MAYTSMEPSDNELLFEDDIIALTEQLEAAKQQALMAENKAELLAEDIECLHKCLDGLGTPRADGCGVGYSMWGRVRIALSEAANQRELELLAVIEKKHAALKAMVDSCSEHHCGLKIADDALVIEPSQTLREHEANVVAEYKQRAEAVEAKLKKLKVIEAMFEDALQQEDCFWLRELASKAQMQLNMLCKKVK